MRLEIKDFFEAAHMLDDTPDLVSKGCANLHGHTYYVIVVFEGKQKSNGMVIDFKRIKNLISYYDHTTILQNSEFNRSLQNLVRQKKYDQNFVMLESQPTAENIALHILNKIKIILPELKDIQVHLCEGYKGEVRSSWVFVE